MVLDGVKVLDGVLVIDADARIIADSPRLTGMLLTISVPVVGSLTVIVKVSLASALPLTVTIHDAPAANVAPQVLLIVNAVPEISIPVMFNIPADVFVITICFS